MGISDPRKKLITVKNRLKHAGTEGIKEILGETVYFHNLRSKFLDHDRTVIVWLPPSYKRNQDRSYPVLYMHDGQNLFDPETSFAGKDWRVDETVLRLIQTGTLQEIIIVGINNTSARLAEYSDSETGHRYLRFIVEELKPFIDENFRTRTSPKDTAIMGSSMGGLISLLMVWEYPRVFGNAGCLSSSFYYGNQAIFRRIISTKGPKKHARFYIDSGDDGKYDAQKMFSLLTQKGYLIGEEIDYYFDRGADHNEPAWAARLARPLLFFFEK